MLSPKTTMTYDMDVMNIHWWDFNKSLTIQDDEDNEVQIHGVEQDTLVTLMRNALVTRDIDVDALPKHAIESLKEIQTYLNSKLITE